jgi:hypothetical protein
LDLNELQLRASPWIAWCLGVVFIFWALAENGAAVSWADLFPGMGLILAGLIVFGLPRFWERRLRDIELTDSNDEVPAN